MQHGFEYKITDHRILSKLEEIAVFKTYRETKSSKARNYIIEHNLKFAIHCANAYITKYPHVDPMDLRSYAILGLYDAIEKYDYNSGVKFISYAVWWVKATITRNVQSHESLVRLPANIHQNLQKSVNKKEFTQEVVDMFNTIGGGMSMDAKIKSDDESKTLGDTIQDIAALEAFNQLDITDLHTKLFDVIDEHLSAREKYIVVEHFGLLTGDTRTLAEIGQELNMSREHARNIKNKAFQKMLKLLKKWK
jgi:RNA polymerase primary sigma factor